MVMEEGKGEGRNDGHGRAVMVKEERGGRTTGRIAILSLFHGY